ncbi:hypothetical protein ACWEPI_31375 [Streptomyces sp. NPDC004262]
MGVAKLDARTGRVRSFTQMLTERQGERLPQRLEAVRQDDLPSLHVLAPGVDRDRDAVIAGPALPWNSGVVEGHVNGIKMFKRQIFVVRASFSLLRKRVHEIGFWLDFCGAVTLGVVEGHCAW